MILTCPECAARYQIEDGRIGPEGRTVRCAACGASWRALPDLPLSSPEPAPAPSEPAMARPTASPAREYREKVQTQRDTVRAARSGVVWAVAGVLVLALLACAVVFRSSVVAAFPPSAALFAAIGLPVNPTGLEFEGLSAVPQVQDERAVVVVSGLMRNVGARAITPGAVRIALLDRGNREVAVTVARSGGQSIPAGQTQRFSVVIENPPAGASSIEARLADEAASTRPATGSPRLSATPRP